MPGIFAALWRRIRRALCLPDSHEEWASAHEEHAAEHGMSYRFEHVTDDPEDEHIEGVWEVSDKKFD